MGTCKAKDAIAVMESWVGKSRAKGTHKDIIDLYNGHKPRARGYFVTYKDSYCDTTISACFIKLNAIEAIGGTECGVEKHIQLFKKAGIWEEDGTIVPNPGDIICFNWDDSVQPNDGAADHIGMVKCVNGKTITTIEGNINGDVGYRTLEVGNGYIRGYAKPKYEVETIVVDKPTVCKKVAYRANETVDVCAYVGPDFEIPATGTVKIVLPNGYSDLCIRQKPDFKVRDRWFKTKDGYISAYRVEGAVKDETGLWYERYDHKYACNEVVKIQNDRYCFGSDGYVLKPDDFEADGRLKK